MVERDDVIRVGIWRCATPRAPRQLPPLPPPNRAIQTPGANSELDKTWGKVNGHDIVGFFVADEMDDLLVTVDECTDSVRLAPAGRNFANSSASSS